MQLSLRPLKVLRLIQQFLLRCLAAEEAVDQGLTIVATEVVVVVQDT
jgi:hypothetical protein